MIARNKKTVEATVVTDSKGSVLWVAIPDEVDANEGECITAGPILERGQREVSVKIRVDTPGLDTDKLMSEIRAKVERPKRKGVKGEKKKPSKGKGRR